MSRPVRRILCPGVVTNTEAAAIHLRRALPHASSDLPAGSGGQPSIACCLVLLRAGFAEPRRSPGALVVSYTTLSPLPPSMSAAVCFLWHFPASHLGWVLPTALPCGVRTFLVALAGAAAAWPTHPPPSYAPSPAARGVSHGVASSRSAAVSWAGQPSTWISPPPGQQRTTLIVPGATRNSSQPSASRPMTVPATAATTIA